VCLQRRLLLCPSAAGPGVRSRSPGLTMESVPWSTFYPMSDDSEAGPLRPGALARLAGVSKDTLRHYERKGLLAPRRSSNGYREYPQEALGRVHLVQRALSVGFTLDELSRLLHIRYQGGAPCRQVRALAAAKLESMEVQLRDLTTLRDHLRELIGEWDARLAQTPSGKRAWLLESWSGNAPERAQRHRLPRIHGAIARREPGGASPALPGRTRQQGRQRAPRRRPT
jgi:DNA-binding transcriptional MerR regulator